MTTPRRSTRTKAVINQNDVADISIDRGREKPEQLGISRETAIELSSAENTPTKKRKRPLLKNDAPQASEKFVPSSSKRSPKKRKGAKPSVQESSQEPTEEKRLRRWRPYPPQSYEDIRYRAMTQSMSVLDRASRGSDDCPGELCTIAGTTGNVYSVSIGKVPSCNCPHAEKGNQCKHIIYILARVLKAPHHLQYQLAFTSAELREIFAGAPQMPSGESNGGERKSLESDCPICFCAFEPEREEIVHCKAMCGNNVHKACFRQWAVARGGTGNVTCPFCRSKWVEEDNALIKEILKSREANEEGYINVGAELGLTGIRDYSTYHRSWRGRWG